MKAKTLLITLFALLISSSALAASVSISSSSLDLDNGELSITADLADFNHTSSPNDYVIEFGIANSDNGESDTDSIAPRVFNGNVIATLNPVCGVDQEILVKLASLDTNANQLEVEALVCNFSNATELADWSVQISLENFIFGDNASSTEALQSLTDSGSSPSIIAFDSFDKVSLALDDGNGSLEIEATVSDLAFAAADEIEVSANLANSDNNEGSTGSATAVAVDADNASVSSPALDCSSVSGPALAIENVSIVSDGASKKVTLQANACNFTHGIAVENAQAWSVVVGLVAGSQSGSSQSAVLEFTFTSSSLVAQLDQQIAAIDAQITDIDNTISAKNALIANYNRQINVRNGKIAWTKKQINFYNKIIKKLRKKIRRARSRHRTRLRKKINFYRKLVRNRYSRIRSEQNAINNLRSKITSLQNEIAALNSQKAQLNQQREDLVAQRHEAAN